MDYVQLFFKCQLLQSPADIIKKVKEADPQAFRNVVILPSRISELFTWSYFVSTTDNFSSKPIK
jgi:hypothetical protein